MTFDWWSKTEGDYHDYFFWGVSIDGNDFQGNRRTGDWSTWTTGELVDFSNVHQLGNLLGEEQIWIAFVFSSDSSVTDEGSYVDNVLLRKWVGASPSRSERQVTHWRTLRPNRTLEFASLRLNQ